MARRESDAWRYLVYVTDKKEFQTHCAEARKKAKNMDLMSYLIMPVQRIPRYELLLKELKSKLDPEAGVAIGKLEEALSKIQSIAQHVNENKRKAERLSELLVIQGKIHGGAEMKDTLLQPHRRLIRMLSPSPHRLSLLLLSMISLLCFVLVLLQQMKERFI
jgi:hypothetical protein